MSVYALIHAVHASVGKLPHKVSPHAPRPPALHAAETFLFRESLTTGTVEEIEYEIPMKPKGYATA